MVGLRRMFQRKELAALWAAEFGDDTTLDYTELRLLDAVRVEQDGGATVGEIARRLGIDPSRASRQVARAVASGLLERHAEQGDGRVVVLRVTRRGAELQEQGSELTRARIALALADWSGAERERFAAQFARFTEAILDEAPHPTKKQRAMSAPAARAESATRTRRRRRT
jgi:DNA-binding MarR family transcriptional regulator